VFLALSFFFFSFSVKHFITSNPNLSTFIGLSLMCLGALVIMKLRGEFKIPVIIGVVLGTLFCQYTIFIVPDQSGLVDVLWVALIGLFAFYGLGGVWGTFVFISNLLGLIYFYIISGYSNLNSEVIISTTNTIINVLVSSSAICFLMYRIVMASTDANRNLQDANTLLQQKNQLLSDKADEKTVLVKEIHHRVKNNLQIVSSIIRLQSAETEDEMAKKIFDASVNRIVAMALIHEKMYQKDDLSKINLEDYINSLFEDIIKSFHRGDHIKYKVSSELEIIGNRTVVPLALILNELATNSFKHGFKDKVKGLIAIDVKLIEGGFTLIYTDDGFWVENVKSSSFGLELIETFTDQLDGEMTRTSNDEGTRFDFTLKNID
jgi:two-component sensor histidine kinase